MVVWLSLNDPTKLGRLFSSEFQWINYWIIPHKTGRHPSTRSRFYGEPDFWGGMIFFCVRNSLGHAYEPSRTPRSFWAGAKKCKCFVWTTFIEPTFESVWANNLTVEFVIHKTLFINPNSLGCVPDAFFLGPWNPAVFTSTQWFPWRFFFPWQGRVKWVQWVNKSPFWVGRFDSWTSETSILWGSQI